MDEEKGVFGGGGIQVYITGGWEEMKVRAESTWWGDLHGDELVVTGDFEGFLYHCDTNIFSASPHPLKSPVIFRNGLDTLTYL